MHTRRQERVAERIQHEISNLLLLESKDPRLMGVNVVDVQVSPDLRLAKVFVNAPGDEEARQQVLEGLEHAASFIRRELARRVQLRYAPEFTFELDDSWKRGARVDELLDQLRASEPAQAADKPAVDEDPYEA